MTRPSRHIRRVRTKHGARLRAINPHIRKRFKNKAIITSKERKVFNLISNPRIYKTEFGGGIDFNKKGGIERVGIQKGKPFFIDIFPDDYEVIYHTHPDSKISPPTPEDIQALLDNKKQQAEIVFRNGEAWTVVKTPTTKALSKLPAAHLKRKLGRAFTLTKKEGNQHLWKKNLENFGFNININRDRNKPIPLAITPVEPSDKNGSR